MQKLVYENFKDCREGLIEQLGLEDYTEEGILDLS